MLQQLEQPLNTGYCIKDTAFVDIGDLVLHDLNIGVSYQAFDLVNSNTCEDVKGQCGDNEQKSDKDEEIN